MKFFEHESREQAATRLARVVADQLADGIQERGFASLAIPGGSTPAPFMQALSNAELDWSLVRVTLTDERLVPADHPRSNTLLIHQNLLDALSSEPEFLAINDASKLAGYSQQLEQRFMPLDVCVLGMGDDGHTASLFPGGDRNYRDAGHADLLARVTPPGDLEERLSLTMRSLATASHIHVLIHGDNKQAVFEQAEEGDDENEMPIRALFRQASDKLVIHYAA